MDSKIYVRLLLGIIGGTITLFLLIAWVVPEMMYMDKEYAIWKYKKEYVRRIGEEQEILFLGDSRMLSAVIPNQINKQSVNLALSGATPIEMYYTLKNYLQYHPRPKAVIIGFAPEHYMGIDGYKKRNYYFHYFSLSEAWESQQQIFFQEKMNQAKRREEIIDDLHYWLRLPTRYGKTILKSRLLRRKENENYYREIDKAKGYYACGVAESDGGWNGEAYAKKFLICKSCDYYMHQLLRICKESGIPVSVEQMPVNAASWLQIQNSGFGYEYLQYMNLLERDTGAEVNIIVPCYEDNCFGDSSHVNRRGAERFSAEMKKKYQL